MTKRPQAAIQRRRPSTGGICAACHLPTGTGHDESAYVAALPARYTIEQMATYKSGARKGSGSMTTIAKSITSDEIQAGANYFATLTPRQWIRVVEADSVPKTYVAPGNKRLRLPGGGSEPIGDRIIEIPENEEVVLNRDPRLGFIAFVPKGSIARAKRWQRAAARQSPARLPRADPARAWQCAADLRPAGD